MTKQKHDKKERTKKEEQLVIDEATVHDDEQKDGVYESDIQGLNAYREIETKVSEVDGMEELHISYIPKNKINKCFKSTGDAWDRIDWSK